ncbi:VWA domain-containing protein [Vibrio sp. SCSIO 43136]|uniref:VWA domain-containing protein n=1 Tax=Vibrio sp. SCSIO 43136 TaxID=2819101 RepID=UPI002075E3EC|nr:VWA domain-containing protein [Vibrio sp. SCSIO 43136]USD64270.1 VWA domain-containing protein [Vibrio sp. SCSIO 43136]
MFDGFHLNVQHLVQGLSQFHFLRPYWLLALLPLLVLLWLRWRENTQPKWQQNLPEHLRKALTVGEQGWKRQLPIKVLTLVVILSVFISAGPSWQRQASPFNEDKASMLVVMDVSDSMKATDIAPSRLERAKHKVRDLISARQGGKSGLVVYSGSAHIAMPLTQDSSVLVPFLNAIEPEIMPVKGKQAESALPLIEQQLQSTLGATVVLISDGVSAPAIDAYADYFDQSSHQLLVLAVGEESASSFDLNSLQALAKRTQGSLVRISIDGSDVSQLDSLVERNMQLNGDSAMPWQDMGYLLVFPVAILVLLWFRRGWLVQWCLLGAVLMPIGYSPAVQAQFVTSSNSIEVEVVPVSWQQKMAQRWWDIWLTPDQQGQRWFEQGEYATAAEHFQDPMRQGIAHYYAREFKQAHSAFMQAARVEVGDKAQLSLVNAASALARQREYLAARNLLAELAQSESLSDTLRPMVENNLEVVSGIVEEINRVSESQSGTTDGPEESFELPDEMPQTADGAEEKTADKLMLKETLNANEILGSQELADKWLSRVESDPKQFLRAKFHLQHLQSQAVPTLPSEVK